MITFYPNPQRILLKFNHTASGAHKLETDDFRHILDINTNKRVFINIKCEFPTYPPHDIFNDEIYLSYNNVIN